MVEWLHADEVIDGLAAEGGAVGAWAQLQRLARGRDVLAPTAQGGGPDDVALVLALGPRDADAFGERALAHHPEAAPDVLLAARWLGVRPTDPERWRPALVDALPTPGGAGAADLLTLLGTLRPDDLGPLAAHHPHAATLPAWVLATQGHDEAVVAALATHLAAQPDHGIDAVEATVGLCWVGAPPARVAFEALGDGAATASRGAALADGGRGSASVRAVRRARACLEAIDGDPLAELLRGWLDAAPPSGLSPRLAWSIGWRAHVDETAEPLARFAAGDDRPGAVAAARAAVRAGSVLPTVGPSQAMAIAIESGAAAPWRHHVAGPLALAAAAARTPDLLLPLFDEPEDLPSALAAARWAPTYPVLERLLALPVPYEPSARVAYARALASLGLPELLPRVRQVADALPPAAAREVLRHATALVGAAALPGG